MRLWDSGSDDSIPNSPLAAMHSSMEPWQGGGGVVMCTHRSWWCSPIALAVEGENMDMATMNKHKAKRKKELDIVFLW